jgi:hypothetical protein
MILKSFFPNNPMSRHPVLTGLLVIPKDWVLFVVRVSDSVVDFIMQKCDQCGDEFKELQECSFCGKHFCLAHYPDHMAYEQRHSGLASEEGRFWRKRTSQPD